MSNLFVTSDQHWSHKNIIKYESRPLRDVWEMDEELIRRWNKKISPEDRVIFLGDFCLSNRDRYKEILDRLNYNSILWIKGNHDKGLSVLNTLPRVFAVKQAIVPIEDFGFVLLSHEPINTIAIPADIQFNFHGHVHAASGQGIMRAGRNVTWFNVCADLNNLRPWHINEMWSQYKQFKK